MSVVVTGGCGFVGSSLVPVLLAAGHSVISIDRHQADHHAMRPEGTSTGAGTLTTITAELTAATDPTLQALARADAVIHLAGCPGVRDTRSDVSMRRQRDNIDATRVVLSATPADVPTLVLSSSSVYGSARALPGAAATSSTHRDVRASTEEDPLSPRGGYAASKVATEQVCRERANTGGAVLVVRPFTVLGEGQRADMAVARWAHQAHSTGQVTVFGDPERTRDFTDVTQVADILLMLLNSGRTGTVNLGTGRARSLTELAQAVCRVLGVPPRVHVEPASRDEATHTLADTTRLRSWTGSVPETDLDDVVARAVASVLCSGVAA